MKLIAERVRTRRCPTCNCAFSYAVGAGKDRKHCSDACRVQTQIARRTERLRNAICSTDGCEKQVSRVTLGLCEACYMRKRRKGTTDKRQRNATGNNREYIREWNPEHPLADGSGMALQHRRVAHDKHGEACPACHWCGTELTWKSAVVDHIDEDKKNNLSENLAVSCNLCNLQRTPAMAFMARITTDALISVMQATTARRQAR